MSSEASAGRGPSPGAVESLAKLEGFLQAYGFAGYDPYDALNSPVLRLLSRGSKHLRIGVTQIMRRLPVNLRPLLGIRRGLNPKGLGLFLSGFAKLSALEGAARHEGTIDRLLSLLEEARSKGCSGNAWGYNFDWQSRAFYVPRGTPTIVNSSFVGHALLDAHDLTGNERALALALPIREFMLRDLNRTWHGETFAFSYTPIDRLEVHNASLLGASFLARLERHSPDSEARRAALAALRYSLDRQRADGSWPYAETSYQAWIDSFHTGFNLQAIQCFLEAGLAEEARGAFERGAAFYAARFFLADGTPRYYHDRTYPIDVHCPAQAIVLFSRLGDTYRALVERIVHWMIAQLQGPEGSFYFRKGRHLTNRIPYIRWGQAWAFHALTEYRFRYTVPLSDGISAQRYAGR